VRTAKTWERRDSGKNDNSHQDRQVDEIDDETWWRWQQMRNNPEY